MAGSPPFLAFLRQSDLRQAHAPAPRPSAPRPVRASSLPRFWTTAQVRAALKTGGELGTLRPLQPREQLYFDTLDELKVPNQKMLLRDEERSLEVVLTPRRLFVRAANESSWQVLTDAASGRAVKPAG